LYLRELPAKNARGFPNAILIVPAPVTIEGMERFPTCSGAEAVRAFERAGWATVRRKGSHLSLTKTGSNVVLTVPMHAELGRGLLRSLIRKAGISIDEFAAYLKG
jgi:predicted RNA binding protein YcfA (HicA-like mRNA interferase family)